jgi:hypothetical protein
MMGVGRSITLAMLVPNGATAYYPNVIQIDGTTVTPKWQGASAPGSPQADSISVYTLAIIKTASNTYTVLGSVTEFK